MAGGAVTGNLVVVKLVKSASSRRRGRIHMMRSRAIGVLVVTLTLAPGAYADPELQEEADQASGGGDAPANATRPENPEAQAWPRQITTDQYTLYLYAPHVESWNQKLLQARAAVAVQAADAAEPTYGVIWLTARTVVDDQKGIVSLQNLTVIKGNFPSAPDGGPDYLALVRQNVPAATGGVAGWKAPTSNGSGWGGRCRWTVWGPIAAPHSVVVSAAAGVVNSSSAHRWYDRASA